ncbi:MAG TPA: SDR family NAD(P)-dependent oxidoreductase, partial [Solirubrobacteraceae bacterium]|nr:SDR family NAD(P)-dependent oxidoreductase [Solirubrobacteraceae bacterium]
MAGRVAGRVIVVTGAGRGQGSAEVAALAAEGATVIGVDVDFPGPPAGARVELRELDVTDEAGWEALREHLAATHGRLDGLINNAGVTSRVRLGEVALEDWNRV